MPYQNNNNGYRRPFFRGRGGHRVTVQEDFHNLPMADVKARLGAFGAEITGSDGVLRSRLKRRCFRQSFVSALDWIVVIDFEATCSDDDKLEVRLKAGTYVQEIIEFPAVLIDVKTKEIVDTFRSYVRPKENTILTEFCTKLTGIIQDQVDTAPTFPEVLGKFEEWLKSKQLFGKRNWCFATDGRLDHTLFLYQSCLLNNITYPEYAMYYLKISRTFLYVYQMAFPGESRTPPNLALMLEHLGFEFVGREHCGLDDATNMARIVVQMLKDDTELRITEKVFPDEVDEERPYCCRVRGIDNNEWLELKKSISDPSYITTDQRIKIDNVKERLAAEGLSLRGSDGVLRSRLDLFNKWIEYNKERPVVYDYIVCLNFSVASDSDELGVKVHEIVDISAACIGVQTVSVVGSCQIKCKQYNADILNAESDCKTAADFAEGFQLLCSWLESLSLTDVPNWCIVVDSRFDLPYHLFNNCTSSSIPYPNFAKQYVLLNGIFKTSYPACYEKVPFPKLSDIASQFDLPIDETIAGNEIVKALSSICVQMILDKVPVRVTNAVDMDHEENPAKPFSRRTNLIRDYEWFRIRKGILQRMEICGSKNLL